MAKPGNNTHTSTPQCSREDFQSLLQEALKEAAGEIVQQVGEKVSAEIRDALSNAALRQSFDRTPNFDKLSRSRQTSPGRLCVDTDFTRRESGRSSDDRSQEYDPDSAKHDPASPKFRDRERKGTNLKLFHSPSLSDIAETEAADQADFSLLLDEDRSPANGAQCCACVSHRYRDSMSSMRRIVASPTFGAGVGVLVLLNCFFMGVETNIRAITGGHLSKEWRDIIETEELIFCVLFCAELSCRICAYGSRFFSVDTWLWNMFDSFIVSIQVVDQVVTLMGEQSKLGVLSVTRMLRLLRLFRIVRIARVLYLFEALGTLVISISKSMSAIVWAILLMLVIIYAFAVLFTEVAAEANRDFKDHALHYWFGSVPRTILTLLESIMGGVSWDEPIVALMNNIGFASALFFCFYISMGLFVMLNVVTGVFVDKTIRTASEEADIRTASAISAVFSPGEHSEPMDVTWNDFQDKLEDPALVDFFELLNVESEDAQILFELIDKDNSGTVDADEIVTACMHLKGGAKAFDVAVLHKRQEHLHDKIDDHIMKVDLHLQQLVSKLGLDTETMESAMAKSLASPGLPGTGRAAAKSNGKSRYSL